MFLNVSSVYSNVLMNSSLQTYVFDGGAAQSMTLTFDLCMCVCVNFVDRKHLDKSSASDIATVNNVTM